ncbi:phosphatase PAP2 family protein [Halobacterium sp. R2-5]|uniref:phosphatase PAP2 family protein n=1 Tax=Halobacterium sp. R2-5 TaxID=2715751 RepID=UPI001423B3EB|nr:phosphatase PAP2 family protein [Halobacterium sp. R2-5]NIB99728.1 phosphatase PAP2 family protein [Halobacterium sp. R2-5]
MSLGGRDAGVTDALAGGLPDALVPVFVVLTYLGSTWFVTTVGPAVYLFGPQRGWLSRRDGARLLAASVGALALVVLAKGAFAEPRPPETVMRIPEEGNGFPSGHAMGSAAFYGALAALLDTGERTRRYAAAAGMIAFVSFTRLVLGVHYLADVVAGALVGAAFVAVLLALTRRRVGYGFGVAVATAAAAVVVVGPVEDPIAALGGTIGALAGWLLVTRRGALHDAVSVKVVVPVLAVLGGAAAFTLAFDVALPAVGVAHAAAGVAFVALPILGR